eukprot:gene4692-6589_t
MSSEHSNFLCNLKYHNTLPDAPSGPFFKEIQLFHSFQDYSEYKVSTLEKSFVWQPHFGPDLGLNLDLVDQDAILVQEPDKSQLQYVSQPTLDQSELKYLNGTMIEKSRGGAPTRKIDEKSKPWWLRNTTYLENNLYSDSKYRGGEHLYLQHEAAKKKILDDPDYDPFEIESINKSFDIVDKTVEILKNSNKKRVCEWSVPILPLANNGEAFHRNYQFSRFDESPYVVFDSEVIDDNKRKRTIDNSLITQIRHSTIKATDNSDIVQANDFRVSLLAQIPHDEENKTIESDDDTKYDWVKDYRMEVVVASNTKLSENQLPAEHFVFLISDERKNSGINNSNDISNVSVSYLPIKSTVELRRLDPENSKPIEAIVKRDII